MEKNLILTLITLLASSGGSTVCRDGMFPRLVSNCYNCETKTITTITISFKAQSLWESWRRIGKNGNNTFIHIFDNVIYLLSINKNQINQGAKKIVELHYEISQRPIVEQFAGKLNFGPEHLVGDSKWKGNHENYGKRTDRMRNEVEEIRSDVNRSKTTNREEAAIAATEREFNYQCHRNKILAIAFVT